MVDSHLVFSHAVFPVWLTLCIPGARERRRRKEERERGSEIVALSK